MIVKSLHIALAYLTLAGFIIRGVWAITESPLRDDRWVKTAPHVVDTLLLTLGAVLAWRLGVSPLSGWLAAKLLGLLAYIGFGVVTMRGGSKSVRMVGFAGALVSVLYVFAVALSRSPWPF